MADATATGSQFCALEERHVRKGGVAVADLAHGEAAGRARGRAVAADTSLSPTLNIKHAQCVHARALECEIRIPN